MANGAGYDYEIRGRDPYAAPNNNPDYYWNPDSDPYTFNGNALVSRGDQLLGGKAYQEYQLNQSLQRQTWQHDLEQWNRQNEYDSPTAQMQRYIDAGMTPAAAAAAVLQNSGAGQPSVSSAAPSVAGDSFGSGLANVLGAFGSGANGFKAISEGIGTLIDNDTRGEKNALQLREIKAHTAQMSTAANLNRWQSKKLNADIWRLQKLTPVEVKKGLAEIGKLGKQLGEIDAHIAQMNSAADLNDAEKTLVNSQANSEKYKALIEKWRYTCITLWGFDPNSTITMAGSTAIMSGKGSAFMNAISENLSSMIPDISEVIKSLVGGEGKGLQGLFENVGNDIKDGVKGSIDTYRTQLLMLLVMFQSMFNK